MSNYNPLSTVVDLFERMTSEIAELRDCATEELVLDVLDGLQSVNIQLAGVKLAAIVAARTQKNSWTEIGAALGISRQAAHKSFGYLDWQAGLVSTTSDSSE